MLNANPATAVVGRTRDRLRAMASRAGRRRDAHRGHNAFYKRAVLIEYGDALGSMMQAESVLHWDRGARVRVPPSSQRHESATRTSLVCCRRSW
jgi:hypothetical protein